MRNPSSWHGDWGVLWPQPLCTSCCLKCGNAEVLLEIKLLFCLNQYFLGLCYSSKMYTLTNINPTLGKTHLCNDKFLKMNETT
jgi:hypothetical protein